MTRIRITNPESDVQLALNVFGTYEAAAEATGTTPSTVRQWRTVDKVPNKHLLTLATKAGMDPLRLYRYCQGKKLVVARSKPMSVLDALISGEPHDALEAVRRKQLLTVWGDRLTDLKETLEMLVGRAYGSRAEYSEALAAAESRLGVTRTHLFRLMRHFQARRQPFTSTKNRENTAKKAKKQRKMREIAAISAIKKQKSVAKLSKEQEITARQMFRYVENALAGYTGVNLTILSRYPQYFRMAVAHEIEHRDKAYLSMKLKAVFDEFPPKPGYRPPKNLKRASYKDKLIAVLSGDISLHDLVELTGVPEHSINEAFDTYCVAAGLSWATLRSASPFHQTFFAEILKGSGHGI